jgi:hypothetical protein
MRSGNPPTSGVDQTLYGRLTLAGPEVRIHLPPAMSPVQTRPGRPPIQRHLANLIPL